MKSNFNTDRCSAAVNKVLEIPKKAMQLLQLIEIRNIFLFNFQKILTFLVIKIDEEILKRTREENINEDSLGGFV